LNLEKEKKRKKKSVVSNGKSIMIGSISLWKKGRRRTVLMDTGGWRHWRMETLEDGGTEESTC